MTRKFTCLAILWTFVCAGAGTAVADRQTEALATPDLVTAARTVLERKTTDKTSEKLLEQIVLTLAARTATPAARLLVEELSARPPQIWVPHEEGGAMIPFVDVGAAARVTVRIWHRRSAQQQASQALRSGDSLFPQNYFSADKAGQAGMLDAVGNATTQQLVPYRDEILSRIDEPGGDRLAAAVGAVLVDTTLLEQVIVSGSASVAIDTIKELQRTVGADAALVLMQRALNRTDIASATLYEVGRLTPSLPAAGIVLWDALGDSRIGGSAAAVLARYADNGTVDRLAGLLQNSDAKLLRQRALLALKLSNDIRARRIADEWLQHQPGVER